MVKDAFNKRKEFLTGGLSETLKKRTVKVLVWPVALYGCETWTLRNEEKDKLEAFEMWLWRKLQNVNWSDRRSRRGFNNAESSSSSSAFNVHLECVRTTYGLDVVGC